MEGSHLGIEKDLQEGRTGQKRRNATWIWTQVGSVMGHGDGTGLSEQRGTYPGHHMSLLIAFPADLQIHWGQKLCFHSS